MDSERRILHKDSKYVCGSCGGAIGLGTELQAGRPRVRFPMVSMKFVININLAAALWSRACWLEIKEHQPLGTLWVCTGTAVPLPEHTQPEVEMELQHRNQTAKLMLEGFDGPIPHPRTSVACLQNI